MTREAIEERIFAALAEFGADEETISPGATWDELDVDSLDLVELAQIIEDEYGVELREADMERMKTVDDAVATVAARL
ncbi:MAG: acyl carrier protein [Thermoleophilia bacterium]|nr:acyl carrier protein [Thermoleophilia bacterium]